MLKEKLHDDRIKGGDLAGVWNSGDAKTQSRQCLPIWSFDDYTIGCGGCDDCGSDLVQLGGNCPNCLPSHWIRSNQISEIGDTHRK